MVVLGQSEGVLFDGAVNLLDGPPHVGTSTDHDDIPVLAPFALTATQRNRSPNEIHTQTHTLSPKHLHRKFPLFVWTNHE